MYAFLLFFFELWTFFGAFQPSRARSYGVPGGSKKIGHVFLLLLWIQNLLAINMVDWISETRHVGLFQDYMRSSKSYIMAPRYEIFFPLYFSYFFLNFPLFFTIYISLIDKQLWLPHQFVKHAMTPEVQTSPPVNPSFGLTGKLGGAQQWTSYGKIILKNKVKLGKISQK